MFDRTRILLTLAACAAALPAVAQAPAPTTTTFDGRYAGVSRESTRTPAFPGAKCPPNGVPAPVTIRNGVIGTPGSGGWEGTVSPQGAVTMRNSSAVRLDGQIDGQGTIRAQYGGAGCTMTFVWRKQSG
jgi:hypothetical protein